MQRKTVESPLHELDWELELPAWVPVAIGKLVKITVWNNVLEQVRERTKKQQSQLTHQTMEKKQLYVLACRTFAGSWCVVTIFRNLLWVWRALLTISACQSQTGLIKDTFLFHVINSSHTGRVEREHLSFIYWEFSHSSHTVLAVNLLLKSESTATHTHTQWVISSQLCLCVFAGPGEPPG